MIRYHSLHRLVLAAVACVSLQAVGILSAQDYKSGDRVTVITWDASFESSGRVVGKPELGDNYTVDRVEGNWLWIASERGYLRPGAVRPYNDAMSYFTNQVRSNGDSTAYHNRGCAWYGRGEFDIAIGDFNEALRLNEDAATYNCRANAYDAKRDFDQAIADYNQAMRLNPTNAIYFRNRASTWRSKGELDKALADYNESIRLDPTNAAAFYGRGCVWTGKEEFDKAIADGTEAIRLDPTNALYFSGRGSDFESNGDLDQAIADYETAIALDPARVCPLNCLAWRLATSRDAAFRDGRRAVELAKRACEITKYADAMILDTLAAAYAEAGDFEHAVEWQTKARDMASEEQKADYQSRLDLFLAGQPYHRPAPTATADASTTPAAPVAAAQ